MAISRSSDTALEILGDVARPRVLTHADLQQLPRRCVTLAGPDEREHRYEGVPLASLLELTGMKFEPEIHDERVHTCVLVEAADGYRAVFALAEIDPCFTDREILLVDLEDGAVPGPDDGPLRVVVPGERRVMRWVRQAQVLRVKRL
jgi:DMSO/TMAO reductase YedYZ molybdopterin-dependent catalytic subunit